MRILLVEDEPEIAGLIQRLLTRNNYIVDVLDTKELALEALLMLPYAAVILDRGLPDGDGLDLIKSLASKAPKTGVPPFIVLSAMGDLQEKLDGFDRGAIDYMTKPYEPEELLARIRVCIGLKSKRSPDLMRAGNLLYQTKTGQISSEGKTIILRRRELAIFDVLFRNIGNIVSHDDIINAVYGYEDISPNSISSHVSRLRNTLEKYELDVSINSFRSMGYRMTIGPHGDL